MNSKPTQQQNDSQKGSGRRLSNWKGEFDLLLIGLMKQEYLDGNCTNGVFSSESWRRMLNAYNAKTQKTLDLNHLKNRLKGLKKLLTMYQTLANKSGWGWDNERHMPIGDNAMWDEIIATNKEYARIRDRPFPIYEDLVFLFAKNIANGRRGNTTAMPTVVRDDDSSDHDMNEIDLDDTNINTEQHNHCPSPISAPTNSFMMNESFDQNMPSVQIDSPISVAPALPDDSPSSSTGKRQRPSATKAARKKKIPPGAYQAMIDLAEQGKIRLQMCHDVYKKEQLYSGELCWARLREKLPNLTIEQKVAIVECFKDASNRWAFMTCEDDMLLPWLMPHINEYYCKNPRTDSPHSSAMPTPSTGLGSTSFSFGFGCAARIGATPPGQSSTIQTGSSFGQGGNMPSIQTLGLGRVVSRFNAPRVSDGNDTPFNLGSWPGNVDTSRTEPSN